MGRDDSWPATVPSVVLSLRYGLSEKAIGKHPKWRNHTTDRESDGRFWIEKPGYQFELPSNHTSISFSFGDIRVWQTDRRTTRTISIAGPHIVAGQLISIFKTISIIFTNFYFCRPLLWRAGCVCVYVTLIWCAQTTESIIMQPLPDCSPVILFFTPNMNPIAPGDPFIEGVKWERSR